MPISKKQRKSSRSKMAIRNEMKRKTTMAEAAQAANVRAQIAHGTYTPPQPKKQPTWRRSA